MTMVYLGLGSNQGDRVGHLRQATAALERSLSDLVQAQVYETDPRDFVDQPRFLNTVVRGVTSLSPEQLLFRIHQIENMLGRVRDREVPKGPRTIDIDILLYGDLVRTGPSPIIPHPRMNDRQFVLVPLLDIDPDLREPSTHTPYASILAALPPQGIYSPPAERYNKLSPQ